MDDFCQNCCFYFSCNSYFKKPYIYFTNIYVEIFYFIFNLVYLPAKIFFAINVGASFKNAVVKKKVK